jgi:photosystem II stability/assembly factor-like uncharacterized protein
MRLSLCSLLLLASAAGADWQPVATDLLSREKTGFGGLSGVAVDRGTGAVYVCLSDRGVFRSSDQGKTWNRHGKDIPRGRTETPGCLQLDPNGKTKRFLMPTVYGGPVIVGSTEPEAAWRAFDKASRHVDWCAADWTDPELKFALAFAHESGGRLLVTRDGGNSFKEVGKGHGLGAWVFDVDTAVVALARAKDRPNGAIARTTDGGKTFSPVAEFSTVSLPRPQGDRLYWLVEGALVRGAGKGVRWEKVSDVKGARYGPVFGKDEKQLFVLTSAGVVESTDGGSSWSKPVAVPKELKGVTSLTWLDYDPKSDVLYLMKMGSDLYKLSRAK